MDNVFPEKNIKKLKDESEINLPYITVTAAGPKHLRMPITKAFEKLKKTTRNKMRKINEGQINGNDKDLMTKIKSKLNGEVEALHLAVSNYFGDCDKRKQKIEAEISEKVDFTDFGYIADTILSF